MSNILLTVPHGYSLAEKTQEELKDIYRVSSSHPQDFAALGFATKIHSYLQRDSATSSSSSFLVVGDKQRFSPQGIECDLNRKWNEKKCFGDFTKRVTQWLEDPNRVNTNAFLIDVHSYPPRSSYGNYDCYLLHFNTHQSIVSSLASYIKEKSFSSLSCANNHIQDIIGTRENYIISLATDRAIKTVLFEVNESLSEEKQNQLARHVAEWLNKITKMTQIQYL